MSMMDLQPVPSHHFACTVKHYLGKLTLTSIRAVLAPLAHPSAHNWMMLHFLTCDYQSMTPPTIHLGYWSHAHYPNRDTHISDVP